MASVITANNRAGRDSKAPAPELKDDNSNFPYRMFFDGGERIVDADTTGECLDCLIPNYLSMTEEARFDARADYALGIRMQLRVEVLTQLDYESVEEWEWKILAGDYSTVSGDPHGWGDGTGSVGGEVDVDTVDVWSAKAPLVLLETSYMPFTDVPQPLSSEGDYKFVSNIIWLRTADELSFLRSLSFAGVVSFGSPRESSLSS